MKGVDDLGWEHDPQRHAAAVVVGSGAAQVERGALPAADDPLVAAHGAPPIDRRRHVGAEHGDAPQAGSVIRSPLARHAAHPRAPRFASRRGSHDQAELTGHAGGRPRRVVGHVEEVAKVRHEHRAEATAA